MLTVVQLRKIARELSVSGRSKMARTELMGAVIAARDILRDQAYDMMTNDFRRKATVAKVVASDNRKPCTSMSAERRVAVYKAQRNGGNLTARQLRRIGSKAKGRKSISA